jgi:hypothetical protein
MPAELETADDPAALVPGDPDAVWELTRSIDSVGVALEDIGLGLRTIDDGGWQGPAAEAFHAYFDNQPQRFLRAADAFLTTAVALDAYACALSWAQRQAAEAIALIRHGHPVAPAAAPARSVLQQVEQTGVLGAGPGPRPPVRSGSAPRAAADTLNRAREQLDRIGRETAAKVRAAGALAPRRGELWHTVRAVLDDPVRRVRVEPVPAEVTLATVAAALHPDATIKNHLAHHALRDDPANWEAGIEGLRRRLRRLGLDQLSPRLKQHIFEGHYSVRKNRNLGYHHRQGGIDSGALRVVRIVGRPDRNGVYRAEVAGPRTGDAAPVKRSSFFPDAWSRDDVLRAIRHAFVHRDHFDPARLRWRGRYADVIVEGVVERSIIPPTDETRTARLYHIVTAYPIYRGKEAGG